MATRYVNGGDNLQRRLNEIAKKVEKASKVRVGFLEGATYPDGKPVAMIAAIQEFGAPSRGIPPRPFFRNMVSGHSAEWPEQIAAQLPANGYDAEKTLGQMGAVIAGELRQSIVDTNDPPLKPATVERKGFDKPLVDTGHMLNSIDFETE